MITLYIFLLLLRSILANNESPPSPQEHLHKLEEKKEIQPEKKSEKVDEPLKGPKSNSYKVNDSKLDTSTKNSTVIHNTSELGKQSKVNIISSSNDWSNVQGESSFLTKGMMVLLSTSLLFMIFVAYKTYRRKSRNARIRKYGVRLTRGNSEMTPLPLDNDDEDDIVFDLKSIPT